MACLSARQSAYTKTKHGFTVHCVTAPTPSMDTNKAHFENLDSSWQPWSKCFLLPRIAEGWETAWRKHWTQRTRTHKWEQSNVVPFSGGAAGSDHSHHKSVSTTFLWGQALRSSRESSLMGEERTARSARRGFGSEGEGNEDITKQSLGSIRGT